MLSVQDAPPIRSGAAAHRVTGAGPAPRLDLPPGEDPAAWVSPARRAGLVIVDGPAEVVVRVGAGGDWEVSVGDRVVTVAPPRDARSREGILALGASLARPSPELRGAPPPAPRVSRGPTPSDVRRHPPASPTPPPALRSAAPLLPSAGSLSVGRTPAASASRGPPPAPPHLVAAPEEGARLELAAGPGLGWRREGGAAPTGRLQLTWVQGAWGGGVGVGGEGSRALPSLGGEARVDAMDVWAQLRFRPVAPIAPSVSVEAGVTTRWWSDDGPVALTTDPVLGAGLGLTGAVGPWRVGVEAGASVDLGLTRLRREDTGAVDWSPWGVRGGLLLARRLP